MPSAFCCPTPENLPQLIVAVSSLMRYNPDMTVFAYYNEGTDVTALESMGVRTVSVVVSHLLVAGLDDLVLNHPEVSRAVHIGSTVLIQDRLDDMANVQMDGLTAGVSSIYMFPHNETGPTCYRDSDPQRYEHKRSINPRYFDTEFMLINLEEFRRRKGECLSLIYSMSRQNSEQDFLNMLLADTNFLNMPGNLNVAPEHTIHLDLPPAKLAIHCIELEKARVVRFPGDIVPWQPVRQVDRASVQLPMKQYLAATEEIRQFLPSAFMEVIEANTHRLEHYIGKVLEVIAEIQTISRTCH